MRVFWTSLGLVLIMTRATTIFDEARWQRKRELDAREQDERLRVRSAGVRLMMREETALEQVDGGGGGLWGCVRYAREDDERSERPECRDTIYSLVDLLEFGRCAGREQCLQDTADPDGGTMAL